MLVHLIQAQEGSDAVVRLTAATALKDCVNVSMKSLDACAPWTKLYQSVSFDGPTFFPYMPAAVQALLSLLEAVESQDAKKRVLRSLNVIVDAVGEQVRS